MNRALIFIGVLSIAALIGGCDRNIGPGQGPPPHMGPPPGGIPPGGPGVMMRAKAASRPPALSVVPDQAALLMAVQTVDLDLKKAKADNADAVKAFLVITKELGVDAKAVSTSGITVAFGAASALPGADSAPLPGYTVTNSVVVAFDDLDLMQKVLLKDLPTVGNFSSTVTYRSSKIAEERGKAQEMAITAAEAKALAIAQKLGVQIGRPMNITEQPTMGQQGPLPGGVAPVLMGPTPDAGTLDPLAKIRVESRFTVTFELVD